MTNLFSSVAPGILEALVNSLWLTLILAGLAWGALRFLSAKRPVNAATRYGIWTLSLAFTMAATVYLGMSHLGAPATEASVSLRQPVIPAEGAVEDFPVTAGVGLSEAGYAADALPLTDGTPTPDESYPGSPYPGYFDSELPAAAPAPAVADASPGLEAASPVQNLYIAPFPGPRVRLSTMASFVALGLIAVWFLVFLARFVRLAIGFVQVQRMKERARVLAPLDLANVLPSGLSRRMTVLETDEIRSPVASGPLNPAVVVPGELRRHLSSDEFRQIVLHEAGHLERSDDWTLLLQRLAECILWFHPVVWWISDRMQVERERACDEWVVSRTRQPEAYVSSIGRLLELRLGVESLALAPGLAANRGSLSDRMRRVLNEAIPASARLSGRQVATAGGLFALVVALLFLTSTLLRFSLSFGRDQDVVEVGPLADVAESVVSIHERVSGIRALAPLPPIPPVPPVPPVPAVPPVPPLPPRPALAPAVPTPMADAVPPSAGVGRARVPVSDVRAWAAPTPLPEGDPLSVSSWLKLLDAASTISSGGDRMQVLALASDRMPDDRRVYEAYLRCASGITSSNDRTNSLQVLMARDALTQMPWDQLIDAAGDISSPGSQSELLMIIASVAPSSDAVNDKLIAVAREINSSGDRARVLSVLAERGRD